MTRASAVRSRGAPVRWPSIWRAARSLRRAGWPASCGRSLMARSARSEARACGYRRWWRTLGRRVGIVLDRAATRCSFGAIRAQSPGIVGARRWGARWRCTTMSKRVLIAAPRSFCAGVVRAIDIVEKLLEEHGPPSTCGTRSFTTCMSSAISRSEARSSSKPSRRCRRARSSCCRLTVSHRRSTASATSGACSDRCDLPARLEGARRGAALRRARPQDRSRRPRGPREVVGTMGEAPDAITLVETADDVATLEIEDDQQVAYLTQTTLSVDDTSDVVDALRERSQTWSGRPRRTSVTPHRIARTPSSRSAKTRRWYWSSARSTARTQTGSSEVACDAGSEAYLLDDASQLNPGWLEGHEVVGLTAGASSPTRSSTASPTAWPSSATATAKRSS